MSQAVLEKLLSDHTGEANAITQNQLAEALDMNKSTLRSEIRRLREQRELPIGNKGNGYYVIQDKEELQDYVGYINGEIESRKRTIEHTLEAFESDPPEPETTCERCGGAIDGDPWLWYSAELCTECYEEKPALRDEFETWMAEV